MSAVVRFENYSWKYTQTKSLALQNVNLNIEEGALVGVIGPNGSGKTTLAYSINGLIPNQYFGVRSGSVYVMGKEVKEYRQAELCQVVGLVFSDPEAQFTAMTVEDEVVFGMENLGLTIEEIRKRLEWVVPLTDIGALMDKPPYEVSGGQKQRVALASVLAMQPPIIVLDEPTSMLDPIGRKKVFEVLGRLKREYRSTIIVIEHSLENLVPLADYMVLLYKGQILLADETEPFFEKMDFLMEHDIFPPGVMEFFFRLRMLGQYPTSFPLPKTLEEGTKRLRELLEKDNER